MTWAYAQNSTHAGFANYGRDQSRMYRAIVDAVGRVAETAGMDIVIPTGKAIQNARSSQLGDTLCRDGYHLDLTVGRFVAACTWYATLSGRCVSGNGFAPESLSESEISIARRSADDAIEN
jgi:hypothetical protein